MTKNRSAYVLALLGSTVHLGAFAYRKIALVDTAAESQLSQGLRMRMDEGPNPYPAPPDTTVNGCKCQTECHASFDDVFACDWCRVEGNCGQTQLFESNWDYCVYPEKKDWEALSASQKTDVLWTELLATSGRSGPAKGIIGTVTQIVGESMRTTFDHHWDVLPDGRSKVIHAQGVHCQFDLSIDSTSPFTGLLGAGNHVGIIRLGSATSIDKSPSKGSSMFAGLGIKFLRNGITSANFVALNPAGAGGNDVNFFASSFSNHVAPPAALQALMKFDQASDCIAMVGLSDVCTYSQEGVSVGTPVFPFEIVFEPTGKTSLPDKYESDDELLKSLASIPAGIELFKVLARTDPSSEAVRIGTLSTKTACVQSEFGDAKLSFRHQRMEEDFALAPHWVEGAKVNGCKPSTEPSSKWKCPGVN